LAILKYVACLIFLILIFNNIKEFSDYFTFQQDSAPAHRAKEMVDLLKRETPDFIPLLLWPSNSPDLNPVDYKIPGMGPSSAAGLQPENPKCGRVATAHRSGMGTPGPARDRQRRQTVASTSSLLCGCELRRADISSKCYNVPI